VAPISSTATNEYNQPGMNCEAVSPARGRRRTGGRGSTARPTTTTAHADGQDQAPVREAGQRQDGQRRPQPVGVDPALVEAVVHRTVFTAVFRQEGAARPPSTIHNQSAASAVRGTGSSASSGPSRWMTR
jgi:hypothetical protein